MIDVIVRVTPEMIHHWGWFLAFGIVLLLLGIGAIVRSVTSTVVSMIFFGWLLIFASVIEFADAFMVGKWAGFFLHLLAAILFGVVGLLMLVRPVISAEAATFLMSMFFLAGGLYQFIYALWTHLPGWGVAGRERGRRIGSGFSAHGAVAGVGALCDRSFRWN